MAPVLLSIVLPCFHPQAGWEQRVITSFTSLAGTLGFSPELIVVDDGSGASLDDALETLKSGLPETILLRLPKNHGKGQALRTGVSAAQGTFILYTDIDFPYTEESIRAVFEQLRTEKRDVAIGVKGDTYYHQVPRIRRVISRHLRYLIRTFLRMPVTDTQCGLKGFTAAVKPVFLSTTINRYLFDLEFVYRCFRADPPLKVSTVPLVLREEVLFRRMNYRILLPEIGNFIRLVSRRKSR